MTRRAFALAAVAALAATPARARPRRPGAAAVVVHAPRGAVPSLGPRHAPVTIEFFCNFAGERQSITLYWLLKQLHARHPRRARIEFHIVGNRYSEAAYEAFDQGAFFAFADAAFSQRARPRPDDIDRWAEAAGMNVDALHRALDRGTHRARADAARARQRRRGNTGRRLAFNGVLAARAITVLEELEDAYDAAYADARALLDDGVPVAAVFDELVRRADAARPPPLGLPGNVDPTAAVDPPPVEPPQLLARALALDRVPTRGPVDAPAVLAVFCSLQSGNCRELLRRIDRVRALYPDAVRVALWPLFDDEVHPDARRAFETALCAGDQGKFWAFVDQLFAVFRPSQLGDADLEAHAEAAGVAIDALRRCVQDGRHAGDVDRALRDAHAAGVVYSPTLVAGRRVYVGMRHPDELAAIVADALRPGVLERAGWLRRGVLDALSNRAPPPAGGAAN
ncbi:MAG: DsbA family protein [Deltaproteobacteria bacterium]|nr:MAG: DsbA family protein [Deltaproteobacteria bacterium]